jgi:type II secretory pathway pseudopilin PulG
MAALLVALSVAAVLMSAVMPTWKQFARREKEAELVFRGEQYARAIGLFQRRAGPGVLPPSIDALVEGHYLRKKFKDPITGQDFDTLSPVQGNVEGSNGGATTPGGPTAGPAAPGRGGSQAPGNTGSLFGSAPTTGRGAVGGIVGVASKSKEQSLRAYKGRTRYNEWQFIYVAQTQQAGQGGQSPGSAPGGPGGTGGVGGRGRGNSGDGGPFGQGGPQGRGPGRFGPQGQSPFGAQPPPFGSQAPTGQPGAQPQSPSGGSIFAPRR